MFMNLGYTIGALKINVIFNLNYIIVAILQMVDIYSCEVRSYYIYNASKMLQMIYDLM